MFALKPTLSLVENETLQDVLFPYPPEVEFNIPNSQLEETTRFTKGDILKVPVLVPEHAPVIPIIVPLHKGIIP